MADFVNAFWNWFIIVPTLGGIVAMFLLNIWLTGGVEKPKSGEETKTMGHKWDETLEEYNNPLPSWWLGMFYLTLVFGLIYLALYPGLGTFAGMLGWTEVSQWQGEMDSAKTKYGPLYDKYREQPLAELVKNPEAVQMGKRLFLNYCAVCHGSDAGGGPGFPNLKDTDWLWGGSPEQIEATILNGRQAMMPDKVTNALSDEDIANLVQYVLSLSGREGVNPEAAAKGKEKFVICSACHGPEGKGNPLMGSANLTDTTWLYGGSPEKIKETITNGRKGQMPAHKEFLGEAKVHVVAAYIYSLSQAAPPAQAQK